MVNLFQGKTLLLTLIFFNKKHPKTFKSIPVLFIIVALTSLAFRIHATLTLPFSHLNNVSPTHLRIDSLFFGTLLAYFYHFHREALASFVVIHRNKLRIGSFILLLPCAIFWDNSPQITTWGFSSLYLGFGGVVLLGIFSEENYSAPFKKVYSAMAKMGLYSYSMYIIHWPLYWWFITPYNSYLEQHYVIKLSLFFLYLGTVYMVGWLISKTIEIPFLALRDKLFPSKSKAF